MRLGLALSAISFVDIAAGANVVAADRSISCRE
jgi:hypothetical protein